MKHSTNRILTTHVGSLPRPADIAAAVTAGNASGPEFDGRLRQAVATVVQQQAENGIDVPSDGELSKLGFANYVDERLTGFEHRPNERPQTARGRDRKAFAEFYTELEPRGPGGGGAMVCTGPVSYKGQAVLERDLANFKAALQGVSVEEAFVPAIAPGTVELQRRNEHYKNSEEYLFAIAEAMKPEYKAIVDAGFILQIDRKSTRLNSSHVSESRMPSSA